MKSGFYLVIALLFMACSNQDTEQQSQREELVERIDQTHEDGSPKAVSYLGGTGNEVKRQVIYYSNGKVQSEGSFSKGQRDGEWKSFYQHGGPWSLNTYKEGILDGPYRAWFENGNLRIEGQYNDGLESGTWKYYSEQGELAREVDQGSGS